MKHIYKNKSKVVTTEQFIEVMNQTRVKAEARSKAFNDNGRNYYWYRLEYLNQQFKQQLFNAPSDKNASTLRLR